MWVPFINKNTKKTLDTPPLKHYFVSTFNFYLFYFHLIYHFIVLFQIIFFHFTNIHKLSHTPGKKMENVQQLCTVQNKVSCTVVIWIRIVLFPLISSNDSLGTLHPFSMALKNPFRPEVCASLNFQSLPIQKTLVFLVMFIPKRIVIKMHFLVKLHWITEELTAITCFVCYCNFTTEIWKNWDYFQTHPSGCTYHIPLQ